MEYDLVGRLMADMDSRLLEFLRTKVNSFVKWDLIHFFHDNPDTDDTAEHIAQCIRRDPDTVVHELAELVGQNILVQGKQEGTVVYSLSGDPQTRDRVCSFVRASADRHFRIKAIYHVIRSLR